MPEIASGANAMMTNKDMTPDLPLKTTHAQASIEELIKLNAEKQKALIANRAQATTQNAARPESNAQSQPMRNTAPERAAAPSAKEQPKQQQQAAPRAMKPVKNFADRVAKIKVIGVGGAGCNAIETMILERPAGIEFIAINTDSQALMTCHAEKKILIGEKVTKRRGAGSDPERGKTAVQEDLELLKQTIAGADIVFIAAGMGGGTGTGATPIIADIAKKSGALTIAVVTKPFPFEGTYRMQVALKGIMELSTKVDTLITVPNDRLISNTQKEAGKDLTLISAFNRVNDVLSSGVCGITDIILKTGLINVDFADIQSVLQNGGAAQIGIGAATGPDRAMLAAQNAVENPLLETSIDGAKAILFNITGDSNTTLYEIRTAAEFIVNSASPDAKIVFGAVIDDTLQNGELCITVIATGLNSESTPTEKYQDPYMPVKESTPEPRESRSYSYSPLENDMDMPAILRRSRNKLT